MHNIITPIFGFILIFSIMALLRLGINFLRVIFSETPKPFEMTKLETVIYGLFISYITTYIIF
jgi:hypothetical protein